jgi:hypothetical protein
MGYIACANCGSSNRDSDSHCYQCEQPLVAAAPPPPPPPSEALPADDPWAANRDLRVQSIDPKFADKGRFKDLASRYEASHIPKTQSNVVHGFRSGVVGGLIVGAGMALYRQKSVDGFTRLLLRKDPKMPKNGSEVAAFSMGFDLIFGLLLGVILGARNLVCFTPDAARNGALLGALIGGAIAFTLGKGYESILIGGLEGLALGTTISLVERYLFRLGR